MKLWLKSSDQYCIILSVTIGLVNYGNMGCCLFYAVSFSFVKKKTDFALGKCTLFVLMINAQSLKILLLFQQLMQETLKAPLHRLYSVCSSMTNVQFSSSGSCFQWASQENLLIKYPLKFYCKIRQFQSLPSL
jgi:hypothetical protein